MVFQRFEKSCHGDSHQSSAPVPSPMPRDPRIVPGSESCSQAPFWQLSSVRDRTQPDRSAEIVLTIWLVWNEHIVNSIKTNIILVLLKIVILMLPYYSISLTWVSYTSHYSYGWLLYCQSGWVMLIIWLVTILLYSLGKLYEKYAWYTINLGKLY